MTINRIIIRAKEILDGAKTIDEMIEKVNAFAACLEVLKSAGYKLQDPVENDYAYLRQEEGQ